jgi:hypothetical protein
MSRASKNSHISGQLTSTFARLLNPSIIGSSGLRQMNAARLREMKHPTVVMADKSAAAVIVPYDLFLEVQEVLLRGRNVFLGRGRKANLPTNGASHD